MTDTLLLRVRRALEHLNASIEVDPRGNGDVYVTANALDAAGIPTGV